MWTFKINSIFRNYMKCFAILCRLKAYYLPYCPSNKNSSSLAITVQFLSYVQFPGNRLILFNPYCTKLNNSKCR